jgi:hypothetical protein
MAGDWIQPLKHLYEGLSATSIFFTHTTQHLGLLIGYLIGPFILEPNLAIFGSSMLGFNKLLLKAQNY